jgi:hypothetical protein
MYRLAFSLLAGGVLLVACSDDGVAPAAGTGGSAGSSSSGGSSGASGGESTGGAAGQGTGGSVVGTGGNDTSSGGSVGSGGSGDAGDTGGAGGEVADAGGPVWPDSGPLYAADGGIATPPGMISIFDGKTLDGWSGNPGIWSIKDDAIDGLTQNGGQLIVTVADYGSFRIVGRARMPQSDNHLGICFWGGRGGYGYNGCIDFVPPSGSIWDYGGGNGIRTYKYVWMGVPVLKTDWHQFEILANLQTGVVHMGVDGHEFPVYTDTRLEKRKKGPIGLQIHAGFSEVQYKDLAVEVDPKEDRLLTTSGPPTLPK